MLITLFKRKKKNPPTKILTSAHKEKDNRICTEASPLTLTHQNGHHQKDYKEEVLERQPSCNAAENKSGNGLPGEQHGDSLKPRHKYSTVGKSHFWVYIWSKV